MPGYRRSFWPKSCASHTPRERLRDYSKSHPAEVVRCRELLTLHLSVVPQEVLVQQAGELAQRLWETTHVHVI